jgi:hypothetical protein
LHVAAKAARVQGFQGLRGMLPAHGRSLARQPNAQKLNKLLVKCLRHGTKEVPAHIIETDGGCQDPAPQNKHQWSNRGALALHEHTANLSPHRAN